MSARIQHGSVGLQQPTPQRSSTGLVRRRHQPVLAQNRRSGRSGDPSRRQKSRRFIAALGAPSAAMANPQAMHEGMSEMMTEEPDRSDMGFFGRLLDWLGRTHPVIVHFPIVLPPALFTAVVGIWAWRRHGKTGARV